MNSEYFKNFINLKEKTKEAYESCLSRVLKSFSDLKDNHYVKACYKLQSELNALKNLKNIAAKDKQEIYRYFVERNTKDFAFLRDNSLVELRILKLTKTPLQNYEVSWLQIWKKLIQHEPEMSTVKLYNDLIDFLKCIRHLYSPDNAVEVIDYFISKHSLYTENIYLFISLFVNISHKTSHSTLVTYIERIVEMYELNQLKASHLLVMFINAVKFKNNEIPNKISEEINKIILYSLTTPSSQKKDSIEPKFNTQTANIISKIIGRCNLHSVSLLKQIFQTIKNFIRPFEDSKKPLKFLYQLLAGLAKRIDAEENYRKKIVRLKQKQQKRLKKEQKLKNDKTIKIEQDIDQSEESAVTVDEPSEPRQQQETKKEGTQKSDQKGEVEGEQEQSEQQSQDEAQSDEDQKEGALQSMAKMQLQIEQGGNQKPNSLASKIQKLETLLKNEITEEIKLCFREFMVQKFEDIFYINSKKIVNKLLKELFRVFPQFIVQSIEVLEKAANIPQINEDGLISNIKHMTKHLFNGYVVKQGNFLQHVLRILSRIKQNRRMADVWQIFTVVTESIPLLDEKDMEKVANEDKALFEKKFSQDHDRFYETYSELVFQSLKRLFDESENYDASTSDSMDKTIIDLISNCYPFFRKRVLKQMEDRVIETSNKFILSIFHSSLRPSKQFEQSLRQLIDNRNIESEQSLELDIDVNIILMPNMQIGLIKKLIRKYSKKNNYRFLKQMMINLTNYNLHLEPLDSTLEFFDKKPTFTLTQAPTYPFIEQKLKDVYQYSLEIIDQIYEEVKEFNGNPLKSDSYDFIVTKLYSGAQNSFKNMKVQKRKVINELLQILKQILTNLFHEMQVYNAKKNVLDYVQSPYKRESFIFNQKFREIIDVLTYNQIFLHDHNIMHNLSALLENEVFFMYRHQLKLQKEILKKYVKKNTREELFGESNLIYMNSIFITKARIAHFSLLNSQLKDSVSIESIEDQLRILVVAPGNDKCNTVNTILAKKAKDIKTEVQRFIYLLGKNVESRFYTEKILSLLSDFNSMGFTYSTEEVVAMIDLHMPLLQSENIKIREQSLRSFQKLTKRINKSTLFGAGERSLRKYIEREKLQIVWIIAVIIIMKEPKRSTPVEEYLQNILQYLRELAKLILSETRIIRRISLFAYSLCLRKAKQSVKLYEEVQVDALKYSKAKTIHEIFNSGYIRDQHRHIPNISNKEMLKKMAPYLVLSIKKRSKNEIYEQIEKQAYEFILGHSEVGLQILKQFHIDMAGSVEQVLSMMHNKKNDLGQISLKLLEGCYVFTKLKKLHFDRIEFYFGERFFRYLLDKDAKQNQFKFFQATREYIEQLISNLEAYDNQTLLFAYTMDVLFSYEKHFTVLNQEIRTEVQKFILKIVGEVIYKGSAVVFKKLMIVLAKNQNKESISFIIAYLQTLLRNKQKVSRVTQLLFTIYEENYKKFYSTVEFVLKQRLEINHNYVNLLINSVIILPEKYLITESNIALFGFIDKEAELLSKDLQQYKQNIYLLSTHQFNKFLIKTLSSYVEVAREIEASEQVQSKSEDAKSKNQLIKSTYSIATNSISAYIQFYETEETIQTIVQLLEVLFRIFQFKTDLFVDYKQLEQTLKNIFSNKYEDISHFERILEVISRNLPKLSVKKQADMLKIITNRPGNFYFIGKAVYSNFILSITQLQQNSMVYKQLLFSLSTILAYVPLSQEEVHQLSSSLSRNQGIMLMQAYVLSTMNIACNFVVKILKESGRDRRNIFCKQLLLVRGKKQYLDNEEQYLQWKEIKQYSNPYHYHA